MPTPRTKKAYISVPKRALRPSGLLWGLWGSAMIVGLLGCWGIFLINSNLASYREYVGQLSPDNDPITVSLPRGAILDEVIATKNDVIQSGETLATLDVPAMERSLGTLNAELLHDDLLKQCLLDQILPSSDAIMQYPQDTQDYLEQAVQECDDVLTGLNNIQERLEKTLVTLHEERSLIVQYIRVLTKSSELDIPIAKKHEDARQALALALLRNQLDKQMLELETQAANDSTNLHDTRLERVQELREDIRRKTELRHHINALLDRPRLQAPKNGHVVYVRTVPQDSPTLQDIEFIEMRPEGGFGYRAHFNLPHDHLDGIKPGDRVRMTLLGVWDSALVLFGNVDDMNAFGSSTVRVDITLDDTSVAQLDDPQIGIALRGSGTASIIHVEKDTFNAMAALGDNLHTGILAHNDGWFISKLARKHLNLGQNSNDLVEYNW